MKQLTRIIPVLLLAATCIAFSVKPLAKEEDTVPPDLGKEPTTLLLLETPRPKVNREFEDIFGKYYSGTILVIPMAQLNSGSYKDIKKYRYYMETEINFKPATGSGNTRFPATYEYSYKLIDRETGKYYGTSNASDAWASLLKRYVKKLEEVWKQNQKAQ